MIRRLNFPIFLRSYIASISVLLLITGCFQVRASTTEVIVVSERADVRLTFQFPPGWRGPIKSAWPSFDIWYFNKDKLPPGSPQSYSSNITIRIDDLNSKHYSESRKSFLEGSRRYLANNARYRRLSERDTSVDPLDKMIDNIVLDGKRIALWRSYNNLADGGQCFGILVSKDSAVSFRLDCSNRASLSQYLPEFVKFMNSVRIERPPNGRQCHGNQLIPPSNVLTMPCVGSEGELGLTR
jgi:hypothetical protein